jgi:hypothetical protein
MAKFDFTRLRRTIVINRVIQIVLLALLVFLVFKVQTGLQAQGRPQRFLHGIFVCVALQLALFYPLSKAAGKDAQREIETSQTGLTPEQTQDIRRRRIFSDFMKTAVFLFFVTFILRAPGDLFLQSIILFTFILTIITYFQCFNFSAKRKMSGQ